MAADASKKEKPQPQPRGRAIADQPPRSPWGAPTVIPEEVAAAADRILEAAVKPTQRAEFWVPRFLAALETSSNILYACQYAGVTRSWAYDYRKSNPEFKRAWRAAKHSSMVALKGECFRRAMNGSDLLMMFMIKQWDPTYRDSYKRPEDADGTVNLQIPSELANEVIRLVLAKTGQKPVDVDEDRMLSLPEPVIIECPSPD